VGQFLGALPAGYASPGLSRRGKAYNAAYNAKAYNMGSRQGSTMRAAVRDATMARSLGCSAGLGCDLGFRGLGRVHACGKGQRALNAILGAGASIAMMSGNSSAKQIGDVAGQLNNAWGQACQTDQSGGTGTGGSPSTANADVAAMLALSQQQQQQQTAAFQQQQLAMQQQQQQQQQRQAADRSKFLMYGGIAAAAVAAIVLLK